MSLINKEIGEFTVQAYHEGAFKAVSKADILGKALAFLLRQGCHDSQKDFAFRIQGIDSLFFKKHGNVFLLQLTDVFKAIQGIPSESAD